jgi:two-component system, OmpR family, alkaline phosphatase synthesis response regulator PhoP
LKILVVEDNQKLLKLISHLFEREGYDVICATSGREGLASYAEHKPDVVCLDVMMEDASGFDVCRTIRAEDNRTIVIIITSKSRNVDIVEGQKAGANDYIVKPFDLQDIISRMREITRGCIRRDDPALYGQSFDFDGLRVYPGQLRGERGGESLDLSLREIRLLRLFHDHRGSTLDVAALKPYCWMQQFAEEEKTIEWHIGHLRRKIEPEPEQPTLIKAVEGGYRHG